MQVMIKWCSYCQQYQGEIPPFENRNFSHGMCASCAKSGLAHSDEAFENIKYLTGLTKRFWNAGCAGDFNEISLLTDEALKAGFRPIDILYGIAGPSLIEVGEKWEAKTLTVEDEHRFTHTCEQLVDLISSKLQRSDMNLVDPVKNRILLGNVEGSRHHLGMRFVALALQGIGWQVQILRDQTPAQIAKIAHEQGHQYVGLSISLKEQGLALTSAVETILASPFTGTILIGGAAVNADLIETFASSRVRLISRPVFNKSDWQKV